jgi:hypothetical protein
MDNSKAMMTLMSMTIALDADEEGKHVDQKEYRSMIGSLLYLTAMRSDIRFFVCLCTRFQASPRTSHRQVVKRIFRYLRYTPDFSLWYSTSSSLELHNFSDTDFAGSWIVSPLLGLASSWVLLWCLGLLANSRVLLNLQLKPNTLSRLVVALSSFGSHTP